MLDIVLLLINVSVKYLPKRTVKVHMKNTRTSKESIGDRKLRETNSPVETPENENNDNSEVEENEASTIEDKYESTKTEEDIRTFIEEHTKYRNTSNKKQYINDYIDNSDLKETISNNFDMLSSIEVESITVKKKPLIEDMGYTYQRAIEYIFEEMKKQYNEYYLAIAEQRHRTKGHIVVVEDNILQIYSEYTWKPIVEDRNSMFIRDEYDENNYITVNDIEFDESETKVNVDISIDNPENISFVSIETVVSRKKKTISVENNSNISVDLSYDDRESGDQIAIYVIDENGKEKYIFSKRSDK